MSNKNVPLRIYHLRTSYRAFRIGIALIFCFSAVFSLFVLLQKHTSIIHIAYDIFATIVLLCISSFLLAGLNHRIEISSEGVTLYSDGFRMYTPWDNITGIARIWHPLIRRSMNVFTFKSPALLNTPIRYGKQERLAVIEKRWGLFIYKPETYIWSLPLFADNLAHANISEHEIAGYICQYAPQVFENMQISGEQSKQYPGSQF